MGIDWLKHRFNPRWHNCVVCRPLHPNALGCSITDTYSLVHRYELMAYQTPAMNSLIHTISSADGAIRRRRGRERETEKAGERDQHLCFVTCVAHCWGAVSFGCKWLCHVDLVSKQKEERIEERGSERVMLPVSFARSPHAWGQRVALNCQHAKMPTAVDHPNDRPSAPSALPIGGLILNPMPICASAPRRP